MNRDIRAKGYCKMELETISYQKVIDGYEPQGDKYGFAAYSLANPRKTAFLSNPSLTDKSKAMLLFAREKGEIVGSCMNLPSRLKVGDDIIETVGGSALEVAENFRSSDAGILLMAYNMQKKEYKATVASGFSRVAVKCHKALGSYILTMPRFMQVRNYSKILATTKMPFWVATLCGSVINCLQSPFLYFAKLQGERKKRKYVVRQVERVPEWVNDIVLNDGHKYMEVHDNHWLQWNLDNMFHSHEDNVNRFYTISENDNNIGFYMIKERHVLLKSKVDAIIGSIVEWGVSSKFQINEFDIQQMAMASFSPRVDVIYTASDDDNVIGKLKKPLFYRRGDVEVAFKDLCKKYRDANNKSLWRLRQGYADTILG